MTNCKNCGAPLLLTGNCEYCGSFFPEHQHLMRVDFRGGKVPEGIPADYAIKISGLFEQTKGSPAADAIAAFLSGKTFKLR